MRLVTVGTGTVVPDADRGSACHWVEEAGTRLILDCGAGALRGLAAAGLPWADVDGLLISHFHADHIAEIPPLIFAHMWGTAAPRTAPLDVWGPAGTRSLFERLASGFGDWLIEPGFALRVTELEPNGPIEIGSFRVTAAHTPHTDESLAFRIRGESAALGYTGDTGPSDALAEFLGGVDLLLAECSLPDELALENHLTPSSLARMAGLAATPRLAVTHVYPQLAALDVPALIRAGGYDGEIIMVSDGLELQI